MKSQGMKIKITFMLIVLLGCMAGCLVYAFVLKRPYRPSAGYLPVCYDIEDAGEDYYCEEGYEGLRVRWIMKALGMGNGIGMKGAYYSKELADAVSKFQADQGIEVSGRVGHTTWQALGYTEEEWEACGRYISEVKATPSSTRHDLVEIMIQRAMDYLGDPYVIGASGPAGSDYGVDCSGLVIQALYAAGIDMKTITPVTHASPGHEYESRNIWASGYFDPVDYSKRKRGDLVFYQAPDGTVIHVAIYIGDDMVVESWPDQVQISPMIDERHSDIKGFMRVFK